MRSAAIQITAFLISITGAAMASMSGQFFQALLTMLIYYGMYGPALMAFFARTVTG